MATATSLGSLLSRLASHSTACSSACASIATCSAQAPLCVSLLASQQLRGLAGFTKAGGGKDAGKKKSGSRGGADDDNPQLRPILPLLEQPERRNASFREGDAAVARAYKQAHLAEHHSWIKDMTVKFKLQQAAMNALPERLRTLAMVPDHTPFPMDRNCLYDTPPEAYRDSSAPAGSGAAHGKAEADAGTGAGAGAPSKGKLRAAGKAA